MGPPVLPVMGPPGASCRWVLDLLVDCLRHGRRRGGQRGWDSGRSQWSRCVKCYGPGSRARGCAGLRAGRGWTARPPAGMSRRQAAGLTREAGANAVTEELIGLVVEAVRPVRPTGHGAAW